MERDHAPHRIMTELLDNAEMRPIHWKIWWLSAMGIFLDGFDLFIIAIALPLIARTFSASPSIVGLIGAAALLGAVVGAALGGPLTDRLGRKPIYILDLAIFIILSVFTAAAWSPISLIALRFLLGIGIGADYPICASYVSAFMPCRIRGKMLIGAFSFQALGMLAAALVGLSILTLVPNDQAWRFMLGFGALPAVIVLILRLTVPESARWYITKGKHREAAKVIAMVIPSKKDELHELAARAHALSDTIKTDIEVEKTRYSELFSPKYIKRTALTAIPWFLMDIATYGVGIFTPIILSVMAFSGDGLSTIASDYKATEGAAFVDIFLVLGFLLNIFLVEKWGRIRLQLLGFGGMALGLLILATDVILPLSHTVSLIFIFSGFMLFNVFMNMGPNATTFILAAELFPTRIRGTGHGFSAGIAKIGGAIGIFLLPVMKASLGLTFTLVALAAITIIAYMVTLLLRIETKGVSLEDLCV